MPALIHSMMKKTISTYFQLIKRFIFVVYVEVSPGECPKPPPSPRSLANSLCRKELSSEGVKGMEACWFLLHTNYQKKAQGQT